jgi:hypothetical protein
MDTYKIKQDKILLELKAIRDAYLNSDEYKAIKDVEKKKEQELNEKLLLAMKNADVSGTTFVDEKQREQFIKEFMKLYSLDINASH